MLDDTTISIPVVSSAFLLIQYIIMRQALYCWGRCEGLTQLDSPNRVVRTGETSPRDAVTVTGPRNGASLPVQRLHFFLRERHAASWTFALPRSDPGVEAIFAERCGINVALAAQESQIGRAETIDVGCGCSPEHSLWKHRVMTCCLNPC